MYISFDKMHGLGNDFVFIDNEKQEVNLEVEDIIRICDRKLGIGCDTLVLYKQISTQNNIPVFNLSFFNQDGSEAELCVNATRCFALLMQQKRNNTELIISIKSKSLKTKIIDNKIFVNIGQPSFSYADLGVDDTTINLENLLYNLKLTDQEISYFSKACAISVGNPHLILFLKKDISDKTKNHIGEKLEHLLLFKNRINISFAKVVNDQEIKLDVFERGIGFTLACGSGACATAFMASKLKLTEKKVRVKQQGGDLNVFIKEDNSIIQKGPATYVFKGSIQIDNNVEYRVYTDGACIGNPGPGGWGAVIFQGKNQQTLSGGEKSTTNNKMELTAPIQALKTIPSGAVVEIFTDSTYVKNGITSWIKTWKTNGWMTSGRTPVKNQELWIELNNQVEKHKVTWHWIKGHHGHPYNEKADQLARNASKKQQELK